MNRISCGRASRRSESGIAMIRPHGVDDDEVEGQGSAAGLSLSVHPDGPRSDGLHKTKALDSLTGRHARQWTKCSPQRLF